MTICDRVPKLNKCCCCIPLRLGGIILGAIYVVGAAFAVAGAIFNFFHLDKNEENYVLQLTGNIIALTTYAFQWCLGVFLLVGILTNRHHWLLPYLWLEAFVLFLNFSTAILGFFWFMGAAIGVLISSCIGLYFWMCIQSLYQDIKGNTVRPIPAAAF